MLHIFISPIRILANKVATSNLILKRKEFILFKLIKLLNDLLKIKGKMNTIILEQQLSLVF